MQTVTNDLGYTEIYSTSDLSNFSLRRYILIGFILEMNTGLQT